MNTLVRCRFSALWQVLCLLLVGCPSESPAQGVQSPRDSVRIMPGFVVVRFKDTGGSTGGLSISSTVSPSLARCGVISLKPMFGPPKASSPVVAKSGKIDISRIALAAISSGLDPRRIAHEISELPDVEYAESRYSYPILDTPNDPLLSWQQSYFRRMKVFEGWSIGKGDSSVVIATIDGGTNWRHEDIAPNLRANPGEDINHNGRFDPGPPPYGDEDCVDNDGNGYVDDVIGWNFTNQTNDPTGLPWQPWNSAHGTTTASLFGAVTNNNVGIAGSSWNCRVLPVCVADPVLDHQISWGPEGIAYANQNGASIINLSWGGYGEPSKALQDVITAATEAGALVIASAGNDDGCNDRSPFYPASLQHVLAVGATNSVDDALAPFSNYGMSVPVYASGVDIWSALSDGTYGNAGRGTSLACPLVSGLAGLLKSAHPDWTPGQIAVQIKLSADTIDGVPANDQLKGSLGHGRVNFDRALSEFGHVGIDVVRAKFQAGWRTVFVPGDVVTLSLTVKNVLFTPATGLQFTAMSLDSSVTAISGVSGPITLLPGEEIRIPDLTLAIGAAKASHDAVIVVQWSSNGNESDRTGLTIHVDTTRSMWQPQAIAPSLSFRSVKAVDRNTAWLVGGDSTSVVYRTVNGGTTWKNVTGVLNAGRLVCVDALDELHAWCGSQSGAIVATTDGGISWLTQHYGGRQASAICGIRFIDLHNGFALGNPLSAESTFVVLRSTDGGSSWQHVPTEPVGTFKEISSANAFGWNSATHGWFGTNLSRVWETGDGGLTWDARPTGLWVDTPERGRVFAVDFSDTLYGLAYHPSSYLARTTDGGSSWEWMHNYLGSSQSESEIALVPNSSFVWAATGQSVFLSTNKGRTWLSQSIYPIKGQIRHVSASSAVMERNLICTGWIVTDSGEVFRSEYSTTGVLESSTEVSSSYDLLENFPNPFNPTTTITCQSLVGGNLRLVVYDLLGREVATLMDGRKVPGRYTVTFDGRGLSSGTYFYRFFAGPVVLCRRMVLLK
jgi:photosystem II stability/assembly factor-like uncharacterized protein